MALRKNKMADNVAAFISNIGEKIDEQNTIEINPNPKQTTQSVLQTSANKQNTTAVQQKTLTETTTKTPTKITSEKAEQTQPESPKSSTNNSGKEQDKTPATISTSRFGEKRRMVTLRLPTSMYEQISEYSQREFISINQIIIRAIKMELKRINNEEV